MVVIMRQNVFLHHDGVLLGNGNGELNNFHWSE
jgi:hypothetical protein